MSARDEHLDLDAIEAEYNGAESDCDFVALSRYVPALVAELRQLRAWGGLADAVLRGLGAAAAPPKGDA